MDSKQAFFALGLTNTFIFKDKRSIKRKYYEYREDDEGKTIESDSRTQRKD